MRFCLLNTFFPPKHFGGDAVFVASLANLLAEEGHHVEVVHCADSFELLRNGVSESPFPLHSSIRVHTLHSSFGVAAPLAAHCTGQDWFQFDQLKRIFSSGFDVIHWNNASLLGAPAAFRLGSAIKLMTLHEYWLICPSHILFRNGEEVCDRRTCVRCTINRGRPPQLWRRKGVIARGLEPIDRFLAPSESVRKRVAEFLPNLPLQVLPHFLPARPKLDLPREEYYLVAARLEKAKGVHTLLPLFRRNGLKLKIAGAGTMEAELRAAAEGAPNIEFLGRVPSAAVPALFSKAKATIVPSVCHETFGLVVLESLQQGTPVYVSDYGALPEVARAAGGRVYASIEELQKMLGSDRPVQADLEKFSPKTHLENYLEIIRSIQAGREPS